MALLDCEGFGFSTNAGDYTTYGLFAGSVGSITAGNASTLGDQYAGGSNNASAVRVLPVTARAWFFGARLSLQTNYASDVIQFNDASGNAQLSVTLSSTGVVSIRDASGTNIVSSAGAAFPLSGWAYLEIGATPGASGSVTVKVNGTVVASSAAVASGTNPTAQVAFGEYGAGQPYFTHFYFCDNTGLAPWNTYLGDVRVQTLMPTANDAVAFAPNGNPSNWQNAAEDPPVPATDYNSSSTVGAQDTFSVGAMDPTLPTVFGVQVKVIAEKTDTGARTFNTVLKSGSATANGTAAGMNTSPTMVRTMFQTDPSTGTQWTNAGVNGAKPGYVIAS